RQVFQGLHGRGVPFPQGLLLQLDVLLRCLQRVVILPGPEQLLNLGPQPVALFELGLLRGRQRLVLARPHLPHGQQQHQHRDTPADPSRTHERLLSAPSVVILGSPLMDPSARGRSARHGSARTRPASAPPPSATDRPWSGPPPWGPAGGPTASTAPPP